MNDMINKTLTKKQEEVLEFITSQINEAGIPPTIREIMKYFGFSSMRSVQDHLKALANKGYINLRKSVSRGIELLTSPYAIPILGQISAGLPVESIENVEGYLDLVNKFTGKRPLFALRVKGDSMEGAGIMEDDMVIVRKQPTAEPGAIVAALVDGEALVKTLKKERDKFVLRAENPNYDDVELIEDSSILGKVVGVVRDYG
jgi:repressor LexA